MLAIFGNGGYWSGMVNTVMVDDGDSDGSHGVNRFVKNENQSNK